MRDEQLFAARAGAIDVDRRIQAFFRHLAIQVDLHVAGALEFFVNHVVHAAAGIDQRGGDNGQRTAFFDVPCGTKEALRLLQGVGVHTARQYLARGGLDGVVGTGETGDRIQQNDHILLVFDQTFGLFDDHFGHLNVAYRRLVEGRGDHFAAHRTLHFGHFFRTLVDEQHDQHHIRMAGRNGMCDVLQHDRFTGFG